MEIKMDYFLEQIERVEKGLDKNPGSFVAAMARGDYFAAYMKADLSNKERFGEMVQRIMERKFDRMQVEGIMADNRMLRKMSK